MCNVDWESALSEGHEFLDEVCPLVQEDVEFCFLGFVVKGSLRVQWQSGCGGGVVGGVVKVGVEVEDEWVRRLSSFRFFQEGWSCGRVHWGSSRWLTCPC